MIVTPSTAWWPSGWWGNQLLEIPNIATGTTATILSDPITIPLAGVEYCAMIQPKAHGTVAATVSVVDATTGSLVLVSSGSASGNSSDPGRGTLAFCQFTPIATGSVRLKVDITNTSGTAVTIDLDHADLTRSRDLGINAGNAVSSTIKNGTIIQGTGRAYAATALNFRGESGGIADSLTVTKTSPSVAAIDGNNTTDFTVTNCFVTDNMDILDDRSSAYSTIRLQGTGGTIIANNNTIRGTGHSGISIYPNNSGLGYTLVKVLGNDIRVNTSWTDAYGIAISGVTNFEVANNTVIPINGRGMYIDGFNNGISGGAGPGTVHDNHIEARERGNLEYHFNEIEATGLRIRNGTIKNIVFTNNTFAGYTDVGLSWAAIGARISALNAGNQNPNSNLFFTGNTFQGIVVNPDPSYTGIYTSKAWGMTTSRVDPGTGLTFQSNTFESNSVSLNFGDNDSGGFYTEFPSGTNIGLEQDIGFLSNTVLKSASGNQTLSYYGVYAGDWGNTVSDIRLIDMRYQGGATPVVTFLSGPTSKDVSIGWIMTVLVTDGGIASAGATVTISDRLGVVFTGTTDATGHYVANVITTIYSGTTSQATDNRNPFTISVVKGAKTGTAAGATITTNTTATIPIA